MSENKVSFEQAMKRLEEIVHALESNQQSLDETILMFEEGLHLVKDCDMALKQFETKVNHLLEENGDEQ